MPDTPTHRREQSNNQANRTHLTGSFVASAIFVPVRYVQLAQTNDWRLA